MIFVLWLRFYKIYSYIDMGNWFYFFSSICACRFLYPIYPLICVAASAVIESFPDLFRSKYNPYDRSIIVTVRCQFTWYLDRSLYIWYGSNKYILDLALATCRQPKLWDQWPLALYYMPLMPVHFLWFMVTQLPWRFTRFWNIMTQRTVSQTFGGFVSIFSEWPFFKMWVNGVIGSCMMELKSS